VISSVQVLRSKFCSHFSFQHACYMLRLSHPLGLISLMGLIFGDDNNCEVPHYAVNRLISGNTCQYAVQNSFHLPDTKL
jgi:hypothetical protein